MFLDYQHLKPEVVCQVMLDKSFVGSISRFISTNDNPLFGEFCREEHLQISANNNALGSGAQNVAGCISAASVPKTSHRKSNNHEYLHTGQTGDLGGAELPGQYPFSLLSYKMHTSFCFFQVLLKAI